MNNNKHHDLMSLAIGKAKETMNQNIGGPFGSLIIDKDGEILALTSNSVLKDQDPTAHGEMNAIRAACKKVGSHDLSGCTLYTTSFPCPMCLGAIIWSNIKKVYYGCTATDADEIGFRDDFIYEFIKGDCVDKNVLDLEGTEREICLKLFKEYHEKEKVLY